MHTPFLSLGAFSVMLTFVLRFCNTLQKNQTPLLKLACTALQAVARKNPKVGQLKIKKISVYHNIGSKENF